MGYYSETAKFRELEAMKYVTGKILDIGAGNDKITPDAFAVDGRDLPGIDLVVDDLETLSHYKVYPDIMPRDFDTVYSSHTFEHFADQWGAIHGWSKRLKAGGHFVLYLPDGDQYNNKENLEHMVDIKYDPYMFWIRRAFCGEGKDFRGMNKPKIFDLVDHGMDIRPDCYSFWCVLLKV